MIVNGALLPGANVIGNFRLVLKFGSVLTTFEMVKLADPAFAKVAEWLFDWPTGTPPNQFSEGVTFKILVDAERRFDVEIRKSPMMKLTETNLPRALGESELMSASFND